MTVAKMRVQFLERALRLQVATCITQENIPTETFNNQLKAHIISNNMAPKLTAHTEVGGL